MQTLPEKLKLVEETILGMGRVVVAYSGGVDSALLLRMASDILGENAIGVTAVSASLPAREREMAAAIASEIGARHAEVESDETADPDYLKNNSSRCFHCKINVYEHLIRFAERESFSAVIDGTNADDLNDHRPGRHAAVKWGVRSPLMEALLGKDEVRAAARAFGLSNWNKPAAACLSSRVPHGTAITLDMLSQIERAEVVLQEIGIAQVRVRHHGDLARIEVGEEQLDLVLANRERVVEGLKRAGYSHVALDLAGYKPAGLARIKVFDGFHAPSSVTR